MQSVVAILDAIANGSLSPADAVARSIDAIEAQDGRLGAFAARPDREDVLAAAARADGPLAGLAVGIKDNFDTGDLPTTYGSPAYAGHRPPVDAALVSMITRAGGIVAGKTVSTEFAFLNPAATLNPHDPERTPGGSSSGSAAAVAAGLVPAATGTQTGGSVIRPAAYCGIAGYKPSFRLLPTVGAKTFAWSLDTCGLFAASVADVALFAAGITGRDLDVEPIDPKALRIGIYRPANAAEADADIWAAVTGRAAAASANGATVVEVEEPGVLAQARDIHGVIQNFEAGIAMADDLRRFGDRMSEILRRTLADGRTIQPGQYDEARAIARRARKAATALFDDVDILLMPSAPGAAPRGRESTGSPAFNKLWTLTGNPCVNIPGVVDDAGMPLGVQAVARFGRDRLLLSGASWLEMLG